MNVPDNGPKIEAVSLVLCALAILCVASRFCRRLFMAGSGVGVDDVLIAAAIV